MAIGARELGERVTLMRPGPPVDDGFSEVPGALVTVGQFDTRVRYVSDAERVQAGLPSSRVAARFVVLADVEVRRTDVLMHAGLAFAVTGIKPIGRGWQEISASAEAAA